MSNQPTIDDLQNNFCANMLNEAALVARQGYPQRKQDLFMEQGEDFNVYNINFIYQYKNFKYDLYHYNDHNKPITLQLFKCKYNFFKHSLFVNIAVVVQNV